MSRKKLNRFQVSYFHFTNILVVLRKINSEFPFAKAKRQRKSIFDKKAIIKSITETVQEERKEEEEEVSLLTS